MNMLTMNVVFLDRLEYDFNLIIKF